jgi:DNA (cytosine-5)-methyltransferase 1
MHPDGWVGNPKPGFQKPERTGVRIMLTLYDEFAGVGGSTRGATRVPGVVPLLAVNHWRVAVDSHAANFPEADHECCDVGALRMEAMPRADIFWASPACPPWTDARGKKRDFDTQTRQQGVLFGETEPDEKTKRARALMEEVPRYLAAMALRGKPVLAGVVENVVQCRLWADWQRWIREIENLGYRTRLIAFNSMHAAAARSRRAPQSRDRLYLAYWHQSLGRTPDWDKWLRPAAYCPTCDQQVQAVQIFKRPGVDMGRYGPQYLYWCPNATCRRQPVTPLVLPALVAIDRTLPGTAIKDRPANDPLAPATLERIKAGIRRYWLPLLTPAGGTWRDQATPLDLPMPTRTTRETDALAVPPLLVPVEGRPAKTAAPATAPLRTQTARNETALAQPALPFLTPLRGGGDRDRARPVTDPLTTVSAGGNHHGLALPPLVMRNNTGGAEMTTPAREPLRTVTTAGHQSLITWAQQLLVPYYGAAHTATPAAGPVGALTARDRYGLAQPGDQGLDGIDVDELIGDVLFRMLEPHEIAAAMAFDPDYKVVATTKRDKVRLYGNAVTPPVAELIVSALVETITGEALEPAAV